MGASSSFREQTLIYRGSSIDLKIYREGFGAEFVAVIDAYLARISTFPEIAPIYIEEIRRQVMSGFPYYEVYPTRILVVAILDLRQDESTIRQRLQP
jgi:hypothetical protein